MPNPTTPPPIVPILVGRREAARALSISVRQLDILASRGQLRARRIGRRVLFHADDIRAFAAALTGGWTR
ncbi:MAG TPA: helix-turn-helix domain-containing protein [Phycisphaerae bacterium]|nr:helix-turn-helix domain-containing protein [Phycisphaerae bacterium]